MYLIFDTETTGLPQNYNAPVSDSNNWPRMVQIAWQLHDFSGKLINNQNFIVKPDGFTIPFNSEKIHGISTKRAIQEGKELALILEEFEKELSRAKWIIGHNVEFDINIVGAEYYRLQKETVMFDVKAVDTKDASTNFCAIPGGKGGKYKWPKLTELHEKLYGEPFDEAHDAAYDVEATTRCFFGLLKEKVIVPIDKRNLAAIEYEKPVLDDANFKKSGTVVPDTEEVLQRAQEASSEDLVEHPFSHLHCHSQFSVLQATTDVDALIGRTKELNMPAIGLTDHGNMMAAFQFVTKALKEEIKPIVGCEFYLCKDRHNKKVKDDGFQTVLLAKNKKGYQNLSKLASIAYVEGFYYLPRIDKEMLVQYKDDIIVTTGGLWGEIPYLILNVGEQQAEEAFLWWKEQFGDDFYVEINRHMVEEEQVVNQVLLDFAKKHDVKYFAANNSYYTSREEAQAHDILLCVKDGEVVQTPKKYIGKRGREFRFGFPNDEFYIKSQDEMKKLFVDLPEAIETTDEIVQKIETFELEREVLLPKFDIPQEFSDPEDEKDGGNRGENNYLRHLTYEGAKIRYGQILDELKERLDFELETIERTGYPGYFLIVQDFTTAARNMGVSVGPGRGSAAGSAVAYCVGITNVDPIKYDLLFERFLNPDRISLPDIDIDFDDEGRQKVIDYVIEKYGSNQVAQIITYGTMAAKSAIRDTARVLDLDLGDADKLAKMVPDISLKKLFSMNDKELAGKLKNNADAIKMAKDLKKIAEGQDELAKTLNQARVVEGSLRNTGIHACGVIITPDDITNFVPVALAKDTDMYCTQFDNSVVEDAGLLKMDFLGLKTLTLIKDTVRLVKQKYGVELVPDNFPLDDEKTFELFQRGETVGIFQYESLGMQKHLIELKPTDFADLIAMNALYRPGPMDYIPSFVKRKHGQEKIKYDLPEMEEFLADTYGITVYQEQVMLLSQKLAGFTKGEADMLRKGMGKKKKDIIDALYPKFIEGGKKNGHLVEKLDKIWKDWERFASYAFNKSHSTCYAWVAYQTAYLKAHYPSEYMVSVLSNNMQNVDDVSFFMGECKRMGLKVLGPDVNESSVDFTVNTEGNIRFGMAAIKGVGVSAVEHIIEVREEAGAYKDIFDFVEKVNMNVVNKRSLEGLAMAGGFDEFNEVKRHHFFANSEDNVTFLEKIVSYGNKMKKSDEPSLTLFGQSDDYDAAIEKPKIPEAEPWSNMYKLNKEKELIGLYLSSHPLDTYWFELRNLKTKPLSEMKDLRKLKGNDFMIAGIVTNAFERMTKNGKPYGTMTLEDYTDTYTMRVFSADYMDLKSYFQSGYFLLLKGKVQPKWGNEDDLEFKVANIYLLSDVKEQMFKTISVKIELEKLNNGIIEEIKAKTAASEGKVMLRFMVYDRNDNIVLDMFSRNTGVKLSDELIDYFENNADIDYVVK